MKKISFGFALIFLLLLSGCGSCLKKSKSKFLVINVLDKDFYDDCHISGSINVPFEQVEQYSQNLDKDTEIIFYCSNYRCSASGEAARMLMKKGFNKIFAYEAGMAEWYQQKLPVVGSCKKDYLTKEVKKFEIDQQDVKIISTKELQDKIKQNIS